jgi:hypothetical protein
MKQLLKLFLFSLVFSQFNLNAQVTLNFNNINEFIFNSREALNFTAINSNPKSFQIKIKGKITDGNGQSIAEFVSTPVMLQTGANVFGRMNIDFQEINYLNADIAEIELKTGTYPSGQYRICIWSTCVTADCDGAGEYAGSIENPVCVQVNVENPTPLLLSYPGDNSEIEETRPVYTWIPPAPVSGIGGLNYKMVLVEMMDGQSKSDALAMNRALIEAEGLPNSVFSHPADINALEEGKWYAWQVQAYVGSTYIASSEQWKFKVKKDTIDYKKLPNNLSYIDISKQNGSSIYYAIGVLKLKYLVRLETGNVNLVITNTNGESIEITQKVFKINPGDNRLDLNLEDEYKFKNGETYVLQGTLLNGELFIVKFIYINPKNIQK